MLISDINKRRNVLPLYNGWDETMIYSAVEGNGWVYADSEDAPTAAMTISGGYIMLAGDPECAAAPEIVGMIPEDYGNKWLVFAADEVNHPEDAAKWFTLVRNKYEGYKTSESTRYAIKKEGMIFDREKLRSYIDILPEEYRPVGVSEYIYDNTITDPKMKYFFCNFKSYDDYIKNTSGVGAFIVSDGKVLSGASAYTSCAGRIEVQIMTDEEYRRRGFALACASALILDCMDKGIYPSWDAANMGSVELAVKLGYHFSHEYHTLNIVTEQ